MKIHIICLLFLFILQAAALAQSDNTELKIFTINHGKAQDMYSIVQDLKSGEGKVTVDPNTNSLIVVDYPANIARITEVIERLDAAQKQVEVKVVIADLSEEALKEIGITSGHVIIPSGHFAATMSLINNRRDSNVRSEMTVRTISNKPAQIQATEEEIFGYSAVLGHHWMVVSPETREAGNMLEVLPIVNNDGTIIVRLQPSSSKFQEDGTIAEKKVLTEVVVNNGDTVAIGGVNTASTQRSSGLPLFKRSRSQKKNVAMFLTATIVE